MSDLELRSLRPEDLDIVTEIDGRIVGRSRQGFFKKRLAAAQQSPDTFITAAALKGGTVVGYAFARVQEGEFGGRDSVAVLDIAGVDPNSQRAGIGRSLIGRLEQTMAKKDIVTLRTQAEWSDSAMINFFAANGFSLSSNRILERSTDGGLVEDVPDSAPVHQDGELVDFSAAEADDHATLARDRIPVRSMEASDVRGIVHIDKKFTQSDRTSYYEAKSKEVLEESGIRVSLVAEDDGMVAGFVMARVDYGEFGKAEPMAVIDTIGVNPGYAKTGVGTALMSQLLTNLKVLHVDQVRTMSTWDNFGLLSFLGTCDFKPSQRLVLIKTIG